MPDLATKGQHAVLPLPMRGNGGKTAPHRSESLVVQVKGRGLDYPCGKPPMVRLPFMPDPIAYLRVAKLSLWAIRKSGGFLPGRDVPADERAGHPYQDAADAMSSHPYLG